MAVFVSSPGSRFCNLVFPDGSVVRDVLSRFVQQQGLPSSEDFYVVRNGRLSCLDDPLQHGAVYHLEPRLCGGKGGFGSMLRALGAQIEKTTNREACRDLSGRRLRDVNHEKEMAEWLKKQTEREAEKEQRRLDRLKRKLSEPKHQFTDPEYQQQCHELSERLEDSVMKGLQASSSSQVKVDDVSAAKRPKCDESEQPHGKKKKKTKSAGAACFWEMLSSEDEDEESPSSSSCGAAAVTMTKQTKKVEPEQSSSSSDCSSSSEGQGSPGLSRDQTVRPSEDQTVRPSEEQTVRPSEDQTVRPSEDQTVRPSEDQTVRPSEEQTIRPSEDQTVRPSEDQTVRPSEEQTVRPSEDQRPPEPSRDQTVRPSEESSCSSSQQGRTAVDLSSLSSVDQLQSLGLDVLKEELMSRGMKCGGTLTERAARLFSVRGLTPDQIDPALLAKPAKNKRK
ncbi:replication stress response regulator SDE2 isoform X3 [Sebastes umbrosus]|uniref:replication stress response regulator SDE2 isoform X3 n=1 Tax=Sebastes umbrosus TaxID=72105 RepID=UPI00189EC7FE|nr:replication stress response regulator SDE2 isoform X3 [Sebastes umbrosus]